MNEYKIGSICKKCGERGASSKYISNLDIGKILRICKNCDYTWSEKPLEINTDSKSLQLFKQFEVNHDIAKNFEQILSDYKANIITQHQAIKNCLEVIEWILNQRKFLFSKNNKQIKPCYYCTGNNSNYLRKKGNKCCPNCKRIL